MESTMRTVYDTFSTTAPISSFLDMEVDPENYFGVLMAVLHLIVCLFGLAGNLLVIVAVLKIDRMATATSVYILNLALADGLFMVGLPFIAFQKLKQQWPFGNLACCLVMALDGVNQFTSVFCLTVMSVDRCLATVEPLRFGGWRTPRRAKIISTCLWLLSLLPVLPMMVHFSAESGICAVDATETFNSWWLVFLVYTFTLGFALPFAVMLASYITLVIAFKVQHHSQLQTPETHHLERQVTRMVAAVVLMFAICWLPLYVLNFYAMHRGSLELSFIKAFDFVVLLSYSWSCANPILYAWFSETFRRHFRTLLCPGTQPPDHSRSTSALDLQDTSVVSASLV